jgi:hypothetical protein
VGLSISTASLLFWMNILTRQGYDVPRFYLLPSANIFGILLAWYVHNDAELLLKDVEELAASKYQYKEL